MSQTTRQTIKRQNTIQAYSPETLRRTSKNPTLIGKDMSQKKEQEKIHDLIRQQTRQILRQNTIGLNGLQQSGISQNQSVIENNSSKFHGQQNVQQSQFGGRSPNRQMTRKINKSASIILREVVTSLDRTKNVLHSSEETMTHIMNELDLVKTTQQNYERYFPERRNLPNIEDEGEEDEKVENKYTLAYLAKCSGNNPKALSKLQKSAKIYHRVVIDANKLNHLEVNQEEKAFLQSSNFQHLPEQLQKKILQTIQMEHALMQQQQQQQLLMQQEQSQNPSLSPRRNRTVSQQQQLQQQQQQYQKQVLPRYPQGRQGRSTTANNANYQIRQVPNMPQKNNYLLNPTPSTQNFNPAAPSQHSNLNKPQSQISLRKYDINVRMLTPMERNLIVEKRIRISKPQNNWMFKPRVFQEN